MNIPPAAGKAGIGIAALIVLLVVIFKVAGCGKTKVDLNDYLSISVAGTDTVGTASYSFDSNGLFMKLAETIGVKDEDAAESLLSSEFPYQWLQEVEEAVRPLQYDEFYFPGKSGQNNGSFQWR